VARGSDDVSQVGSKIVVYRAQSGRISADLPFQKHLHASPFRLLPAMSKSSHQLAEPGGVNKVTWITPQPEP
jgi:hypothetical protein